ncbi:MAG: Ppx/GppA family phosphatase [Flavobacteriaceae bacterium]
MANLYDNILRKPSPEADERPRDTLEQARELLSASVLGRIPGREPVAVIDIGSNSVRLVVYEGMTRAPTPVFNEKMLCGLGRSVASKGILDPEAVEAALACLKRFRLLCDQMLVGARHVLATAAVREASNGDGFVAAASAILGVEIDVLSGGREAELAGYGVLAGIDRPDGICGDLGGGSLELVDIAGDAAGNGETLPLGGLRLKDVTGGSVKQAASVVDKALDGNAILKAGRGREFYAVGGTFRALARLHMAQCNYPLHVLHNYAMNGDEAMDFARIVRRVDANTLDSIEQISSARRELLALGAIVLEKIVEVQKPSRIVVSSLGVREGYLYDRLDRAMRGRDPLIDAASEMAQLRSRSPRHAVELCEWTDAFMASTGIGETPEERRMRHAACLLADIGWRAHPDYRGEQSLNIITHANFTGIDHPDRAYVGLSVYYRHMGLGEDDTEVSRLRELTTARKLDRARILGGAFRVAYMISASMPGLLPRAPMIVEDDELVLRLPGDLGILDGERVRKRLRQCARLIGRKWAVRTG